MQRPTDRLPPSHACSRVAWLSGAGADPARGYACDFTAISMHAVSSDPDSFAQPCLYVQLDGGDGPEEEDDDAPLPELRLVPADAAQRESTSLSLTLACFFDRPLLLPVQLPLLQRTSARLPGGASKHGRGTQPVPLLPPAPLAAVDAIFQAFCDGAERNPDEEEGVQRSFLMAAAACSRGTRSLSEQCLHCCRLSTHSTPPCGSHSFSPPSPLSLSETPLSINTGGGEGQGDFFFDRAEVLAGAAGVALSSLDTNDADELAGEDPGRFGDAEEEGGEEEDEDGYEEFEGEQGAAPPANGSHKKG